MLYTVPLLGGRGREPHSTYNFIEQVFSTAGHAEENL